MVIHDDWNDLGGYPHDKTETSVAQRAALASAPVLKAQGPLKVPTCAVEFPQGMGPCGPMVIDWHLQLELRPQYCSGQYSENILCMVCH